MTTLLQSLALSVLLIGGAHAGTASHPAPASKAAVVGAAPARHAAHARHAGTRAAKKAPKKVDVNTADAKQLHESLVNIGPSKAAAIVAWRKSHGAFRSADELAQVKGIGLKTIDKNRNYIVLGSASAPAKR
ncbi:MAG: helix-hairpin-helix domain-containing protein [Proteobacteria bacterium]|nr:helix-hairpin-helix domain-containing protein [Pseudomonadota bacterium]